ncbi:hypothetical protein [Paenibacillus sp. YYML68]|uniref:hypothetical protein n=1 Tax=Paenibacillus sp. YYML68 TaxID=2909250 RepID=UPI002490EA40|nr:hypothetical protein [Paenibacillus sp. YYML68]
MYEANFLELFWDKVKSNHIQNYPMPVSLHHGLAHTVQLEDRKTNLLWLPYEYTGLAYVERIPGSVDIFPYYRGMIVEAFELSHGMDLHKPKREEAVLKQLYSRSWELHQVISAEPFFGTAADYLYKFHHLVEFLKYFNSAKKIPV